MRWAATVTKRGGRRGQCNNLTISHEERRASGHGRRAAKATNRGGRWSRWDNLTIIPWMLARRHNNNEQQFELPPSLNTVSLWRIFFFLEIRSPQSVTPFFSKTPHFPLNQIKLPLRQSLSRLVIIKHSATKANHPYSFSPSF